MNFVSNFVYPLIFDDIGSLKKYRERFENNDIEIRSLIGGSILKQPFFKEYLNKNKLHFSCPNAKKIHELGFYIPNNPELTKEEKELICNLIK